MSHKCVAKEWRRLGFPFRARRHNPSAHSLGINPCPIPPNTAPLFSVLGFLEYKAKSQAKGSKTIKKRPPSSVRTEVRLSRLFTAVSDGFTLIRVRNEVRRHRTVLKNAVQRPVVLLPLDWDFVRCDAKRCFKLSFRSLVSTNWTVSPALIRHLRVESLCMPQIGLQVAFRARSLHKATT